MAREESVDSAYRPVALVGSLTRLLADPHPEVVFNTLFCVNCLMGEPPQSWGREGIPSAKRMSSRGAPLISAAARVAAERENDRSSDRHSRRASPPRFAPRSAAKTTTERVEKRRETGRADATTTTSAEAATEATT